MLARSFAHREIASKQFYDFILYACTVVALMVVYYLNVLNFVDNGILACIVFYNWYHAFSSFTEFYLRQSAASAWNTQTPESIGSATYIADNTIDRWFKIIEENKL